MRLILIILVVFAMAAPAMAQKTKLQLQRQKEKNRNQLNKTNQILSNTKKSKGSSLAQLRALKEKIRQQSALVSTIKKQTAELEKKVERKSSMFNSMQNDMEKLKEEYANMIYESSKISYYDKMMFVFTSSSINDMLLRVGYLESYGNARTESIEAIKSVMNDLKEVRVDLEASRDEKLKILKEQSKEQNELEASIKQKNALVRKLSSQEGRLRRQIERAQKQNEKLESLIAAQIAKEKDASREVKTNLDASGQELSTTFRGRQGKLIWPVSSGFISKKYGKQAHPVLSGITIENLGVDIQTNEGATVKAVYEGQVSLVQEIPNQGAVVFVQHGEYYTVYSNLKSTSVSKGDKVSAGDKIGVVNTGEDGISELQFQLWRNNKHQDPQTWLKRK